MNGGEKMIGERYSITPAMKFLIMVVCFVFMFALFAVPSFADDLSESKSDIEQGITKGLDSAYDIIKGVAGPIGAIAMVVCGAKMLWGNQKSAEEAKSAMIRIVIAMAIIFLGPIIIGSVSSWFKGKNISEISWNS